MAQIKKELGPKILYYNAYTEDLFYWDNDLDGDTEKKLCKFNQMRFTNTALNFLKMRAKTEISPRTFNTSPHLL
ncbi:MAG: hypothetical protein R2738_06400 [Bacteroides graminisolvens]